MQFSWWDAIAAEPAFHALLAERKRRFPEDPKDTDAPIFDVHVTALRAAGFREVGVIWQHLDNRVLMAVR